MIFDNIDNNCIHMSDRVRARVFREKGFTLVEVMIAGAAATVICGTMLYGLVVTDQVSKVADEKMLIESNFERALLYTAAELQETRSVTLDPSQIPPEVNFVPVYMVETAVGRTAYYHQVPQPGEIWFGPQVLWFKRYPVGQPPTDINPLVDQVASGDPQNCPNDGWNSSKSDPKIGMKLYLSDIPSRATKALICVSGITDPSKYPYTRHTFTKSMVVNMRAKSSP